MHVIYSVGFAMQELEMKILNNITWQKPNPPPHLAEDTSLILQKHFYGHVKMKKQNINTTIL